MNDDGIPVTFSRGHIGNVYDFSATSISEEVTEVRVDRTVTGWIIRTRDGTFQVIYMDGKSLNGVIHNFQLAVLRVVNNYRHNH